MPRFVILEHDHPVLHWDFMLEAGNVLRTWRLEARPSAGTRIRARGLGDHRLAYLDYEGPLTGARGAVWRWDSGTFTILKESTRELAIQLVGQKIRGAATLHPLDGADWLFQLEAGEE